jgi:hypothetical protein
MQSAWEREASGLSDGFGMTRGTSATLHPDRDSPGLERPSQAEAFARGMRSVKEGIEQRKSKLEPINARYRERRKERFGEEAPVGDPAAYPETTSQYSSAMPTFATMESDASEAYPMEGVDVFARESLGAPAPPGATNDSHFDS